MASRRGPASRPISAIGNREVTTIEGLSGPQVAALKAAWADVDVVQCGYCQSGQLMAAAALLKQNGFDSQLARSAVLSG
jgi:isoquinoline 1-oxidoreductase subunit alpha